MDREFTTGIPKIKWKVLNIDKAKQAKIKLLDIDEKTTLLEMNLADVPNGWTVVDWINHLIEDGIIFRETF